jgi:hypothetical protein
VQTFRTRRGSKQDLNVEENPLKYVAEDLEKSGVSLGHIEAIVQGSDRGSGRRSSSGGIAGRWFLYDRTDSPTHLIAITYPYLEQGSEADEHPRIRND